MSGSKKANLSRRTFLRGATGVAAGTVAAELAALGIDTRAAVAKGARDADFNEFREMPDGKGGTVRRKVMNT